MSEYIKKEDALNAVQELPSVGGCSAVDRDDVESAIMNIPTADVVEVMHGMKYNDGVYIEVFAVKDGVRYNAQVISLNDVTKILTNSLLDGIQKIIMPI